MIADVLIHLFDYIGVIAFSISGAMIAIRRDMDIFGCIVLGTVTSLGGGTIRDIALGFFPLRVFSHHDYLVLTLLTSITVFTAAYILKDKYLSRAKAIEAVNNVFDAIGLGVFTANGIGMAISQGYARDITPCVFMGMITGIGGGLVRDIMSREMPVVLYKHVYALASAAGAVCYYVLFALGFTNNICFSGSFIATLSLRLFATWFKWNLPRVLLREAGKSHVNSNSNRTHSG